ncbi:probable multidrug resistance-associated protein lethal(2)03659 [Tribolium castaneum]|uniref:probable multidrug resistance-associated protein lethal(2)03659 n=1 Tax=Tribolium castaneum TaxID=7070 RepID=UPI00077D9780|nr:PREDICTED: probable multidrug resistance-associated protein lethal(2)03659 [Tribolium castaneum]|eukprot:XP_015838053.1 PREDICTED: probable multidrug resistance-associated protein lethal(2)03659 [Tribolium castaneum]
METKNKQQQRRDHPVDTSNFLSNWLFCWVLPVVGKATKTAITEDSLYATPGNCQARVCAEKLEKFWFLELKGKNPSLTRAIMKSYGFRFFFYGCLFFPVDLASRLFQPYYLQKLLDYYTLSQKGVTQNDALFSALMIVLFPFLRLVTFHTYVAASKILGMKAKVACSSLIYRKCLQLKKNHLQRVTTGQLINLLSNDVRRFDCCDLINFVWIGPAEVLIGIFYVDVTIGRAATSGVLVLILCFFLQLFISKHNSVVRRRIAEKTDHRIGLINDLISGMQIIKMYAWEKPFTKLISIARSLELKEIKTATYMFILNDSFKHTVVKIIILLGVSLAALTGLPLTPQYFFAMASTFENLKMAITLCTPLAITQLSELKTTILRIQKFLLTECHSKEFQIKEAATLGIEIKNLGVKWDNSHDFVLKNLTLTATCGQLTGIVGPAGGGKSTLLQTIIKETKIINGTVSLKGRISYASQEAWIFSASVRQNILFGEAMDEEKYRKVLKVCALEHDLALFPYGDNTLVGERGIMLSGGQKARINLARSVYRDADIYLLDDPLSAVDAQVARIIFKECVQNYLKDKCVVLVTHQVSYLQKATKIYSLTEGRLECIEQLEQSGFAESNPQSHFLQSQVVPTEVNKEEFGNLKTGHVYKTYFTVGGKLLFVFVMLTFVLIQVVGNCQDYFLSFWLNLRQNSLPDHSWYNFFSNENCLLLYGVFLLALILIIFINSWLFVSYTKKASSRLHNKMLTNVAHADMKFFHNNASGRILNRFSMDIGCIDQAIPLSLVWFLPSLLICIGNCLLVCVLNYWMVLPTIILIPSYYCLGVVFMPVLKSAKRTEGITRSPIFSHLTATLQGLATIKAFNAQDTLLKEFEDHQNLHISAQHLVINIYALLSFIADFICNFYVALIIFGFFLLGEGAQVANVGLAIHLGIYVVSLIAFVMITLSNLDSEITSVERVLDYTQLPPELDGTIPPPKAWPSQGRITFRSVSLKYSPTEPPVLKKVSFTIEPGEKIGIVGRTGAGKSSLVSTLFRLFPFEGTILIDNIDTKSIPLKDLRSKISVIPQDPVLFLGTLRKNLDPFDEFTDAELWSALEDVELKSVVRDLDSEVSEGGSNFSVGQKQLLCLVRAMLRRNKIVVLDEATANIDLKTDVLIQSAIRRKFHKATVLTVAHRLNTVMDSDRILVMNDGVVVEFGSPKVLLEDVNGFFYQYCVNSNKMTKA